MAGSGGVSTQGGGGVSSPRGQQGRRVVEATAVQQGWAVGCGPERPVEEAVRGMAAQGGQAAGRACLWLPVLLRVCVHPQGPAGLVSLLCSFQSFWLFCLSLFPCPFLPIISCRYPSNYVNL